MEPEEAETQDKWMGIRGKAPRQGALCSWRAPRHLHREVCLEESIHRHDGDSGRCHGGNLLAAMAATLLRDVHRQPGREERSPEGLRK